MFNLTRSTPFTISISPEEPRSEPVPPYTVATTPGYIALKIGRKMARFVFARPDGSEPITLAETIRDNPGYIADRITTYWYSFDRSNYVVKYGKGYIMEETTLLEHHFIPSKASDKRKKKIREEMDFLFDPKVKKVVMLYDVSPLPELKQLYSALSASKEFGTRTALTPDWSDILHEIGTNEKRRIVKMLIDDNMGDIEVEKKVDFHHLPLVSNLSPFVIDSSKATLLDIDENKFLLSASLPTTCIELYSNVKNIDLNSPATGPDYIKLTDAIGYSINTKGCILNRKIEENRKHGPFDSREEVYLRVTLGLQKGESPGIPYVLEIWPSGCGSPIHNHGNTYAVIHVLYGGLTIEVYNKDLSLEQKLTTLDVKTGDVTWISPNWYQSHRLWNHTGDYCATIQCYQYGENDRIAWPYFDYVDTTSRIAEFFPDSDFDFVDLKREIGRAHV